MYEIFPRRPLVGIVICYMAGTWLGLTRSVSFLYPLAGAGLFLLFRKRKIGSSTKTWSLSLVHRLSTFLVYLCVVFLAWSAVQVRPLSTFGPTMEVLEGWCGAKVEITGVVSGDPDVRQVSGGKKSVWNFPLRIEEIRCGEDSRRTGSGKIDVFWYGSRRLHWTPGYGERWLISGTIKEYSHSNGRSPPGPAHLPGTGGYYLSANWHNTRFLEKGHGWWILERCYAARKTAAEYLASGIKDHVEAVGLLHALLLGYRGHLRGDIREVFASTGTLHIFAISGLHVGMIALLITFLLKAFRVSRMYWVLFLAPLLIIYTFSTGARASAVRACIMAIIYFLAPLLGRKADSLSAVALAALIILVAAPTQLLEAGFIYSFVVVTGLILLYPYFERPMRRLWEPDPFATPDLRDGAMLPPVEIKFFRYTLRVPRSALRVPLRGAGRYVCSLIALSCSAWLVSSPLTAYFFGRFVPVALLGNLFVIPLAFLIVLAGCLSIVLGSCIELLAEIFNHANLALIYVLVHGMDLMASVPCGSISVSKPLLWMIMLWYAVLTAGILWARLGEVRISASGKL